MSLKSKIEAVIYASEEPVTLQQLAGLLADEAQAELDEIASEQASLPLDGGVAHDDAVSGGRGVLEAGTHEGTPAIGMEAPVSSMEEALAETQITSMGTFSDEVQMVTSSAADDASYQAQTPPENAETSASESSAAVEQSSPEPSAEKEKRRARDRERAVRDHIRRAVDQLIRDYSGGDRGIEIREVASGFRMGTKPEYHDAVRGFVKSLKPALKLTLPALETLAVVAYKQPVTAAEISEIRGVDSSGVLGGLMTRKLIATAGRKQVIGRPMLYKTTRDFLLRFGLKDVNELPSMEEFERMAGELAEQEDLPMEEAGSLVEEANQRGDAEHILETNTNTNEPNIEQATAEIAAGGIHRDSTEEDRNRDAAEVSQQTEEVVAR